MTKLINMSQDKNFSNFHQSFVSESPKLELSYDQEPLSNYLEPHSHDIFDTRRFTPKHNQSNYKTATPDRRSRSSAIKNNSARPSSAKMISKCLYKLIGENPKCHGHLSKKIVNLEKKQELWKERASVWNKERKSYQNALENVRISLGCEEFFGIL